MKKAQQLLMLTHNEGKSIVAERFIRIVKNEIFKYITSISKNVYIDKLEYIVNKYNNAYHRTIKMKPADVKWSIYIDFNKKNNKEGPKFNVGDHVKHFCKRLCSKSVWRSFFD